MKKKEVKTFKNHFDKFPPILREMVMEAMDEYTANVFGLCVRWGFPALKPNSSTNFNLSTND